MKEEKEPKDLGIKIGSKAEKFWTDFEKRTEEDTENLRYQIEANEELLKLAKRRIAEEKERFK